jgi:hypothetical protein
VVAAPVFADAKATRVVVLDNENLLEGEVKRVGDAYEIRRPAGGDLELPARRVLAVVADRKAAFVFVAGRANQRDPDERLRLARWCDANDLADEALAEARAAVRLRPGFIAAEKLVSVLQERTTLPTTPLVVRASALSPATEKVTDIAAVEYNSESFPLFASRINAILINQCATCHAREDAKGFKLTRVGGRNGVTRNMMAALPHVNPKDPAASPILTKSILAHGNATTPAFKTKTHPAYEALETWARFARAPEGTSEPMPIEEPRKLPDLGAEPAAPIVRPSDRVVDPFGQESTSVPLKTQPKRRADDPFDPAGFNNPTPPRK